MTEPPLPPFVTVSAVPSSTSTILSSLRILIPHDILWGRLLCRATLRTNDVINFSDPPFDPRSIFKIDFDLGYADDIVPCTGQQARRHKQSRHQIRTKRNYENLQDIVFLAQVVSSTNPTYMHNIVLKDDGGTPIDESSNDISSQYASSSPGRAYMGVIETHAGYTLVEVSSEEQTAVVSERLTAEAVSCRLMAYPPANPLSYVPAENNELIGNRRRRLDRLPFLPWRKSSSSVSAMSPSFSSHYGSNGSPWQKV